MRNMELPYVIGRIIGPTSPIGEINADARAYENLKELIALTEDILEEIKYIADFHERPEHSMKKIGLLAKEFLNDWGVDENNRRS